ncbi:TonB family protein [Roseovarius sp. S1116L3]|uniref:energy transducer TonB family protein n=1 Tax=Roseovarius roseus TaxID=3342636 RepID=UPI00372947F6
MRRAAEFAVFLVLAAAAHLALAALGPEAEGAQSAGQGGAATVTLQAASAQVSDMVARWETPPEALELEQDMPAPAAETAPTLPAPDTGPVPMSQGLGLQLPSDDSTPDQVDTSSATPAAARSEVSDTRPRMRPAQPPKPTPAKTSPQTSQPKSQSSAAQTASGSGGSANAGSAGSSAAATLSAGQRQSLVAQWGAQVRSKIERSKRYPSAARGAEGTVHVRITIARDGSLRAVSVATTSGHAALDAAALRAVKSARRFPPAPRLLDQPSYTFTLAMRFST